MEPVNLTRIQFHKQYSTNVYFNSDAITRIVSQLSTPKPPIPNTEVNINISRNTKIHKPSINRSNAKQRFSVTLPKIAYGFIESTEVFPRIHYFRYLILRTGKPARLH